MNPTNFKVKILQIAVPNTKKILKKAIQITMYYTIRMKLKINKIQDYGIGETVVRYCNIK